MKARGRETPVVAALLLPLVFLACADSKDPTGDDDDNGAPSAQFTGTYLLTSINGSSLPAIIPDESGPGCDQRIVAGSITLNADLTFTATAAGRDVDRAATAPCDETFSVAGSGTFQRDGDEVVFNGLFESPSPVRGELSGSALSVTLPGEAADIALRFENQGDANAAAVLGAYTLLSIAGEPLPLVDYEDEEVIEEIVSASLTLSQGGGCVLTATVRETDKQTGSSQEETGSTSRCGHGVSGSSVVVHFAFPEDDLVAWHGSFSGGNTLTVTDEVGDAIVFRK